MSEFFRSGEWWRSSRCGTAPSTGRTPTPDCSRRDQSIRSWLSRGFLLRELTLSACSRSQEAKGEGQTSHMCQCSRRSSRDTQSRNGWKEQRFRTDASSREKTIWRWGAKSIRAEEEDAREK